MNFITGLKQWQKLKIRGIFHQMLPEHDAQNIRTSVAMSLLTKHQTLLGQQT